MGTIKCDNLYVLLKTISAMVINNHKPNAKHNMCMQLKYVTIEWHLKQWIRAFLLQNAKQCIQAFLLQNAWEIIRATQNLDIKDPISPYVAQLG